MSNFKVAVVLLLAFLLMSATYLRLWPSTRTISGEEVEDAEPIAELETVELGGMEQWVLIRGADRSNPVLLWLHGGPGAAQMPLSHHVDGELEEEFVVVHWDQRGAGKSNHRGFDESTMTFEQFMDDAHQLTEYLQQRLDQEKIYLLGHSWGSYLGLHLAQEHPEDYYAFIGVGQLVDNDNQVGYQWLREQVEAAGNQDHLETLEELGEPPYLEQQDHVTFANLVDDYGGGFDLGMDRLVILAARAPEYTVVDYWRWLSGANRGSGPMWDEVWGRRLDVREEVPALEVPAYFFAGARDYNTPLQLVEEYYRELEAPRKDLVVFSDSALTPFLAELEKFQEELLRVKEQTFQ